MPYPSESCAGLYSRFGESPCQPALDIQCRVLDKCGKTCNRCVDHNSKRLCILTGKFVKCGCNCKAKRCSGGRKNACCRKGC